MTDENETPGEASGLDTPLGRITQAMLNEFRNNPESEPTDKIIVLVTRGTTGGIRHYNFEDEADVAAYLFGHLRAVFQANGQDLQLHPMPGGNPNDN